MHPGIISHFTTMAPHLKVFPRRTHQHDWPRSMKSGFTIQLHYWKTYSQTWISKMSSITHLIKSVVQMVHTTLMTSHQVIGLGNKQYIFKSSTHVSFCLPAITVQDTIIKDHPEAVGAFLISLILGSDKTTVSVATGHTCYWPLYLSIGNIHNNVCCGHHNSVVLLGFLAILKSK